METFAKANLTGEADRDLASMVKETNDGFSSGKVTKNQLLSWIVCSFRRKQFEKEKEQIRAEHFDKIAHLTSVIKAIKEAEAKGEMVEIDELLSPLKTRKLAEKSDKGSARDKPRIA